MTINRTDLVIFKPEQLGSSDQAGGQRTANPVVSGQLNNLFPPISDIDHAQSAVQLAKCYPALYTDGVEQLIGAHIFINQPPVDPLVNTVIVESDDLGDNDRTPEMIDIMESSLVMSGLIGAVNEGMIAGQDTLTIFSSGSADTLTGTVNVISVEYTGTESLLYPRQQHYFKVLTRTPGSYYDPISNSTRAGMRYTIDPAMSFDAPALNVSINGQTTCTKLRATAQSNSVVFHGVSAVTETVAEDSTTIPVSNTQTRLVPNIVFIDLVSGFRPFYTAKEIDELGSDNSPNIARRVAVETVNSTSTTLQFYGVGIETVADPMVSSDSRVNPAYMVFYTAADGSLRSDFTVQSQFSDRVVVQLGVPAKPATKAYLFYFSLFDYTDFNSDDLPLPVGEVVVPNTVKASSILSGSLVTLIDINGELYQEGTETLVGTIDYSTGAVVKTNVDYGTISYIALIATEDAPSNTVINFSLGVNSPKLDGVQITALNTSDVVMSATSDIDGVVTGAGVSGTIDEYGAVSLTFTTPVYRGSVSVDVESVVNTVPPIDFYNFNPLRIPNGGLVPIYRQFGVVALQHSAYQAVVAPAPAQVKTIRAGARFVDIIDSLGASLWTPTDDNFTVDLVEGEVTINSDFTGFTAPFTLVDTIGELGMVTAVGDESLQLQAPTTREYPVGTTVASVQKLGDLQAVVGTVFDMSSWAGNWDTTGSPANGNLNVATFPIELSNKGTINEDWAIVFTSATAFNLIGRSIGLIASGDTLNDFAPINPLVGLPYMTIPQEAFGGGWNAGEAIRFPTFAAAKPVMFLRVVESGHSQTTTDRAIVSFRGNEA